MNKFVTGLNETTTENGRKAYQSTTNFCLDLFYKIGASRGKDLTDTFIKALDQEPMTALKIVLWARDIRGGCGERQQFKDLISYAIKMHYFSPTFASKLVKATVQIGRFDDLKIFFGSKYEHIAVSYWVKCIDEGNGLAAKWSPRKDKKGASPFRALKNMNEQQWRKYVVAKTDVVEQKMCANKWDDIDYSKLPSQASSMYRTAFYKHSEDKYTSYIEALQRGDKGVKVNAGAIYPYQLINRSDDPISAEQWKSLPDYIGDSKESFLPVVDVSGSMVYGAVDKSGTTPMDVAISLGLYCAERNKSAFKDVVCTFHEKPTLHKLQQVRFHSRVSEIKRLPWGMSTDIDAVYRQILSHGVKFGVSPEDMPTKLLIISDMQFNAGVKKSDTLEGHRRAFEEAGYVFPQIVFWNVSDRSGSIPVTVGTNGTALISGFSPSNMKSLLCGDLNPVKVMEKAISDPRYDVTSYN